MVDAGAQIGSPRVTLTACAEALVLDDRQTLVVIHGDDDVHAAREELRRECRVGGNGPAHVESLPAQLREHRLDHVDLLAAQVSGFARMRIEAEHGDARRGDARSGARDRACTISSVARRRSAVIARGTSASGRWVVTSATRSAAFCSIITGRAARVARREIFGVSGEVEARVDERALLHRRRHHGGEFAAHAAVASPIEHGDDVGGVARIEPAGRTTAAAAGTSDLEAAGA